MKQISFFLFTISMAVTLSARERCSFDFDWLFILGDGEEMVSQKYDDSRWRKIDLPHDWAVEGAFSESNPSGTGGGALPGGVGWYRKHFTVNDNTYDRIYIDFDGVYMNSTVWLNGCLLGHRPYGYSSFEYDMTPYINKDGENVLAVRVDNSDQPNSRWYSGCGIYRHVWLVKTAKTHVAHWGTHVVPSVDATGNGGVTVDITLDNSAEDVKVVNTILDASGRAIAEAEGEHVFIGVPSPYLWSIERPYIYKVSTKVYDGDDLVDSYDTPFGFRYFNFDAGKGFSLNGVSMKINGVCDHHDLGCLGAALNEDALHRQLILLKRMGCNAIRCSHNPPAPELLNMCDTMGFIVMDESYDIWLRKKTARDYAQYFKEWHERDLSDMLLRDRNHPSILIWSIGNEVLEQWNDKSGDTLTLEQANLVLNMGHDPSALATDGALSFNSLLTRHLAEIVHRYDTTRPITAGCNEPNPRNHLFRSGAIDLIGYNYHNRNVKDVPKNFPGKPFIFSESISALATRGWYRMPSDSIYIMPRRAESVLNDTVMKCSAYDNCHVPWGTTHEETWDLVKHNDFVGGQFLWTGWDYLGEPTPYGWPARSSYFGVIDLAGFPKDVYYMYQSEWTDTPVLHLFPHWNWTPGEEIDMWCYYNNADKVELIINGVSKGFSSKTDHRYHAVWRVRYEPGTVEAVAYKGDAIVRRVSIKTAGKPYALRLSVDRASLKADRRSMAFVTAEVVDKEGNLCPNADNMVSFTVDGARLAGVDNGCQYSLEPFKADCRKAFFGKCLAVIQSDVTPGTVTFTANSPGLKSAVVTLQSM